MRLDELERELRAERPEIEPDFASRLDEWAARGFPRGGELDPRRSRAERGLRARLRSLRRRGGTRGTAQRPTRLLGPAGATAAAAMLLVLVGVVAVSPVELGGDDGGGRGVAVTDSPGESGEESGAQAEESAAESGGDAATEEAAPAEGEQQPRAATGNLQRDAGDADRFLNDSGRRQGAVDAGRNQRRQARTISLSLATSPEDFRASADGVLDVVDAHNGFVMRSSVSGGDPDVDEAELGAATFELRIPAARLQGALGALSDLGHVVSRTDGSRDITARFQSARDRIETYSSARDNLLDQLEDAVTESEQESIRRRLQIVERRLENARDDLAAARQRVRQVPVTVEIAADRTIDDGGGWDAGEALDDAGDILRVALGVALVSAAVLLPLALLALIGFLIWRGLARHRRERALDDHEG